MRVLRLITVNSIEEHILVDALEGIEEKASKVPDNEIINLMISRRIEIIQKDRCRTKKT